MAEQGAKPAFDWGKFASAYGAPALFGASAALRIYSSYRNYKSASRTARRQIGYIKQESMFNRESVLMEAANSASLTMAQAQIDSNVRNNKAMVSNINAARSREEAFFNAARIRDIGQDLRGTQRAQSGKAGVRIEGSVEDVMYASAIDTELDAMTILYEGETRASDLEHIARSEKASAKAGMTLATSTANYAMAMGRRKAGAIQMAERAQKAEIRHGIKNNKPNFWMNMLGTVAQTGTQYYAARG